MVEQTWDDNGRLETQDDGNDNTTTLAYTNRDQLKTITYADTKTKTITYNKIDLVKTITDPNGSVVTNTMNDFGGNEHDERLRVGDLSEHHAGHRRGWGRFGDLCL